MELGVWLRCGMQGDLETGWVGEATAVTVHCTSGNSQRMNRKDCLVLLRLSRPVPFAVRLSHWWFAAGAWHLWSPQPENVF